MAQIGLIIVVILALMLLSKAGRGLVEAQSFQTGCFMVLLLLVGYFILSLVLKW